MSARSDLVNAAASVLSNPAGASGGAVESGTPPSETGLMGAAMPAGTETDPVETDDTRVTEGEEGAEGEGTETPAAEAVPEPEPAKAPEPKPAKPKFDAKGYSSQHAALTRRMKAVEAAETKVKELISIKESEFLTREQKIAALEKLDELDEMELIRLAAERRGKSPNDILRVALWKQAGYQGDPNGKPEGQEPPPAKVELPPEIMKMIKESNDEAKAAKKALDDFKAEQMERDRRQAEQEDTELTQSIAEHALGLVNEDAHPYLSVEDPGDIAEEYLQVANEQAKYYNAGKIAELPTPEEILEHLEVLHEKAYMRRYERLQARQKGSTPAPSAQAAPPEPPVSKSPEPLQKSSSGPKAITNAMTAQTGPGVRGQIRKERELINDAGQFLKSKGF